MLELAILGLLKEQELHGYELKKRLVDALGPFSSVSFGSLYPALARLQRAGAVTASEGSGPVENHTGPTTPMTGSIAGEAAAFRTRVSPGSARPEVRSARVRKVYAITGQGHGLFDQLLADSSSEDDRAFSLRLAFCRYLPQDARLRMLERRRAHLVERLARAHANSPNRRDRMDSYMRSLVEHDTESTERDISWLDTLIATEKGRPLQ